jgi:hypothetical protein
MYCWPDFFATTMFLTDIFHSVNHKYLDEYKYNKHNLEGREDFQGPDNTPVSEQINNLMKSLDRTVAALTITTALLVHCYYVFRHNTELCKALTTSKFKEYASRWRGQTPPS